MQKMDLKYSNVQDTCSSVGDNIKVIEKLNGDGANQIRHEDILLELGMFSPCDSFISSSDNNNSGKDDLVSVDDLNNVSKNDLLFSNVDSYENLLSDSDLLNSISDTDNFYNETVTLYGGNNSKEITFDYRANLLESNSEPTSNFNHPTNKHDVSSDITKQDITSETENLENIVPNLNVYTNSELNCSNPLSENYFHDVSSQIDHILENILPNNKTLENELILNKSLKDPAINVLPQEDFNLLEFLNFKGSKVISTNDSVNSLNNSANKRANIDSLVLNGFINVPKKNFNAVPLRNAKIITPHKLTLLPYQSNFVVPVKKFKSLNGMATTRLNIKQSEINNLKSLRLVNNGFTRAIICNNEHDLRKNLGKSYIRIQKSSAVGLKKDVQALTKDNRFNVVEEVKNNFSNTDNDNSIQRNEGTEKIKKPELVNNVLTFNFSADIKKSFGLFKVEELHKDNDRIYYYTGIPKYSYFMALLNCLNLPSSDTISPFQMLLMTLMKIRLNLDWMDLAYRFDKNVQTVKETFGITVYVLKECLTCLVHWPMQEHKIGNYCTRSGMDLYIYGIKLNINCCSSMKEDQKIFVCLSTLKHPIHFVSKPIAENEYNSRLDLLACSGIKDCLTLRDVIIFDDEIDYPSSNGNRTVLSVISKNHESFCDKPYDNSLSSVEKMKNTISEIKKYKFLYEEITCSWTNESKSEFALFCDVVNVVCSLVNLCHVLPFCNNAVRNIISRRKNLEITVV